MKTVNRPISPHLQVYKLPHTAILSILHRATGVALAAGSLVIVYWLSALVAGPEAYANATDFLGSWFGKLILFGWTAALFYHLCNGARHLLWDMGYGFDLPTTNLGNKVIVGAAVVLTILVWIAA